MAADHRRVEVEVTRLDDLLHEARAALKAKFYNETYLRGVKEAIAILEDVLDALLELRDELEA